MNIRVKGGLKALWGSAQLGHGMAYLVVANQHGALWNHAHEAYLFCSLGVMVYGMTGLSELIAGMPISALNAFWVRIDNRPVLKCLLSILCMVIFFVYIDCSILWCALFRWLGIG